MLKMMLISTIAAALPITSTPLTTSTTRRPDLETRGPTPTALAHTWPAPATPGRATSRVSWVWPLSPRPPVLARFRPPRFAWGTGHRGVDLGAFPGQQVRSAGPGRVGFVGRVAGRGVVVVAHRDGLRTTYEPVDPAVVVGAVLTQGDPIGVLANTPGHCPPVYCLHWGLRRGETYLDPLLLLSHGPPVLLPLDRTGTGTGTGPATRR